MPGRKRFRSGRGGFRSRKRRILKHPSWGKFAKRHGVKFPRRRRAPRTVRRKVVKRFKRRKFSKKPSKGFTSKVLKALSSPQEFLFEYGQEHQLPIKVPETPGTTNYNSQTCIYVLTEIWNPAVTNKSQVVTLTLMNNRHLLALADRILMGTPAQMTGAPGVPNTYSSTTGDNLKARIGVKGSCTYSLRNQSTEPVQFTLFYCRPRSNIAFNNTTTPNVYSILSTGFANNGIDNSHVNADTNLGMNQACYSPFNSFDFTRDIQVGRVQTIKIQPGQMRKFVLRTKTKLIRPADIAQVLGSAVAGGWGNQVPKYQVNKHERFILIKAWGQPAGWGATQANYTKSIQITQPGFILHSKYRYECYKVSNTLTPSVIIESQGITDNSTAHAPAIVVPDAAVVGSVSVAI